MNAAPQTQSARPTPNLHLTGADRRRDKRFGVARPGKVFRRATQQYAPASTRNLSIGGALLEVDTARPFSVGELIDLGVAFTERPVVESRSLVQAVVTRVEPVNSGRQVVAVRYVQRAALAAAA